MPKRLTTKEVKDLFYEYGYIVPDDFVYINSKQPIRVFDEMNRVHVQFCISIFEVLMFHAATKRQRYFISDLMNMPLSENETEPTGSSFERWSDKQSEEFNDLDAEYKEEAFRFFNEMMPFVAQARNTKIEFDEMHNIPQIYGLVQALKEVNFGLYDVRLKIIDADDRISFTHANENTINFLFDSFYEYQDVGDSMDLLLNNICDVKTMHIEFIRKFNFGVNAPGFFPFINKSDLDLSMYGIYNDESDIKNESCLLTAIRSSGLLNDNQMNLLNTMLRTRNVMKSDLRKISDEFKFNVHVRTIKEGGKDSHYEIINDVNYPKLKLVVVFTSFIIS